jgi:hypothetical protein
LPLPHAPRNLLAHTLELFDHQLEGAGHASGGAAATCEAGSIWR